MNVDSPDCSTRAFPLDLINWRRLVPIAGNSLKSLGERTSSLTRLQPSRRPQWLWGLNLNGGVGAQFEWRAVMFEVAKSDSVLHSREPVSKEATLRTDTPAIALVDSDEDFQESACMALSDHGFAVSGFSSGQALLAYFDQGGGAEAIVLDWKLADGMGLQLLENLRLRGIGAPVVFLTSVPAAAYENLALGRGAADFVDKARGVEIFAKRLHLIIEGARPGHDHTREPTTTIRHGSLAIRPDIMRAYWKGIDVGLTLTEFNIVHRLVKNLDDYISYRQIYD